MHVSENAFDNYVGVGNPDARYAPPTLPPQFKPLTYGCSGDFYVVGFEDRQSNYYTQGTRSVSVTLSSTPVKYFSNDIHTEITITKEDPTARNNGDYEISISQAVNNGHFANLNTARDLNLDHPHGCSKLTYSVDLAGKLTLIGGNVSRLDEDVISWRGGEEVARWLRNLSIERAPSGENKISYRDCYMIGRDKNGMVKERGVVTTEITEKDQVHEKIEMTIGLGPVSRIIYESPDGKLRIGEAPPAGMRAYTHQMEIVTTDPSYSLISQRDLNETDFAALIHEKVTSLIQHWNKPHSVLGNLAIDPTATEWRSLKAPELR